VTATGSQLTTHVLDTALGGPATGLDVVLESADGPVASGRTDADGRISSLGPERLPPATYRLRFATGDYLARTGRPVFFPEVVVAFTVSDDSHHHVPLLLSPYAYSTYRGS
jgi:5-hydroxyisourate hydrolase